MPRSPGYPEPSDFLNDLRFVYRNEEPEGGEKTARQRRMREMLKAEPAIFFQIMSRHQDQYDRRVAYYWARRHKMEGEVKKEARGKALAPEIERSEVENRALDVLEGL